MKKKAAVMGVSGAPGARADGGNLDGDELRIRLQATLRRRPRVRETIYGTDASETIRGLGDYLARFGGGDSVLGGRGDDLVRSDAGNDRLGGGTGADTIHSRRDRAADMVDCGAGYDFVRADRYDVLAGCEKVQRF